MKCQCVQGPELRQTGHGTPAADLICPVCYTVYWSSNGRAEKERPEPPFKWPGKENKKNDEPIQTSEIVNGRWT